MIIRAPSCAIIKYPPDTAGCLHCTTVKTKKSMQQLQSYKGTFDDDYEYEDNFCQCVLVFPKLNIKRHYSVRQTH